MVEGGDQENDAEHGLEAEPDRDAQNRQGATRGRRAIGYAVGGLAVLIIAIAVVAMVSGADGDSGGGTVEPNRSGGATSRESASDVLPEGGLFKVPEDVDSVEEGAEVAGCELESVPVKSKDHVVDPEEEVRYSSSPPTSGRHDPVPAQDGAYAVSPDVRKLVHTLEHSRVIIWFKRDLPAKARASLKAFYDSDSQLVVLVPDTTGMKYDVAATAWNAEPRPRGTGRLLGCPRYSGDVYTALDAFKDRHRGRGPELIP